MGATDQGFIRHMIVTNRPDGIRHEHFAIVRKPVDGGVASHGVEIIAADCEIPMTGVAVR